ncbi:MAG TPA: hypothetical protein DEQ02_04180 [Ruminococcaceae bacterium]|nr:hypothetical protein [Oscillospiraceae bacterium]
MNKKTLIWVTSLLCLLPIAFSVAVYSSLPEQIAIHWNNAGTPDSFVHKAIAAFGIPLLFLIINLFSKIRLLNDPKGESQSQAIKRFAIWLIPALSVILVPVTLSIAMGADIPIVMISTLLVGILMVIIGNYLPKSRQNYTIGIKLPWTLNDADNWNKTHRLAGYLWIIGGLLLIACNFLLRGAIAQLSVTAIIVAMLILTPILYSYMQYTHMRVKK